MSNEIIEIEQSRDVSGVVAVQGAKNGILPVLLSSVLTNGRSVIRNVPKLSDVVILKDLLRSLGYHLEFAGEVTVEPMGKLCSEVDLILAKKVRASFWLLAPLLARFGEVRLPIPGGDIIGARPIDIHLAALRQMGAEFTIADGVVHGQCSRFLGADIEFKFPSVGATHQVLMAACMASGRTVMRGVAREPEVITLGEYLNAHGGRIDLSRLVSHGQIEVEGVEELRTGDVNFAIRGDRIVAGTLIGAAVIARTPGTFISGIAPTDMGEFLNILQEGGVEVFEDPEKFSRDCSFPALLMPGIGVRATSFNNPNLVKTSPFPGLATDLQPIMMAILATGNGRSVIREEIYEDRFGVAGELNKLGFSILVKDRDATVEGIGESTILGDCYVEGGDLRACACLILAGLRAQHVLMVGGVHHLRRGYEDLVRNLQELGVRIRLSSRNHEFFGVGC